MTISANEKNQKLGSQGGFSFIELLVVMIIFGILAQISITIFIDMRSRSNDAKAIADGRNLLTVANINFVNLDDVDYERDATETSPLVGTVTTDLQPRSPIYELSAGVRAEITGSSTGVPNEGLINIRIWHTRGSKIGGITKDYNYFLDEEFGTYSFPSS